MKAVNFLTQDLRNAKENHTMNDLPLHPKSVKRQKRVVVVKVANFKICVFKSEKRPVNVGLVKGKVCMILSSLNLVEVMLEGKVTTQAVTTMKLTTMKVLKEKMSIAQAKMEALLKISILIVALGKEMRGNIDLLAKEGEKIQGTQGSNLIERYVFQSRHVNVVLLFKSNHTYCCLLFLLQDEYV